MLASAAPSHWPPLPPSACLNPFPRPFPKSPPLHLSAYPSAYDACDGQVIPSQDYYGHEHDDPLNGIVMQYEAQPFNRDGWGGLPMDLTLCVEKDKTTFCLQVRVRRFFS